MITHFTDINIKHHIIGGGTAGNHTVTGLEIGDNIRSVWSEEFGTDGAFVGATNLTSEFTSVCTVDDSASNAGGTNTTGLALHFLYVDIDES